MTTHVRIPDRRYAIDGALYRLGFAFLLFSSSEHDMAVSEGLRTADNMSINFLFLFSVPLLILIPPFSFIFTFSSSFKIHKMASGS